MQKPDLYVARKVAQGLLLLVTLIGSGAGLGYWAGIERSRTMLVEEREDHLAAIDRLQEAYGRRLGAVTGDVATAARAVSDAAGTVAAASETAQAAATTDGKAAKAAGVPAAVIEQDRKALNSAIGKANARIGEAGR